jgi:radical SAM-linked protein
VTFAKTGPARFFGHLELVNLIVRALRRAGIALKYSEGFHPMPKIAFTDPLPLGMESFQEFFFMTAADHVKPADVTICLNEQMPEGMEILDCTLVGSRNRLTGPCAERYRIRLDHPGITAEKLAEFHAQEAVVLEKITKKGKRRQVDLKTVVQSFELNESGDILVTLIRSQGKVVRPGDLVCHVFGLEKTELVTARILKQSQNRLPEAGVAPQQADHKP